MTKDELNLAKSINECVKALSKNGVSEPFTVYIDEARYSKKVVNAMKKVSTYNVVLKFVPKGTSIGNILAVQNAIGEQVE